MAESTEPRVAEDRLARIQFQDKPEGPIAAAIIAGGIGAAALGLFTTLAEASEGVKDWLQWSDAVGPLSGKVLMGVLVWLVAWAILHLALRNKPYETRRALVISLVLIGLGVLGTFPLFFQAFGG
jgi:hypothetical protein